MIKVNSAQKIYVNDQDQIEVINVNVSAEIEVVISPMEKSATLFFNDYDLEFRFNAKTAAIINKMIDSNFGDQIHYMQLLRNYEIRGE